jgi:hypothetical protein
LQTSGVSSTVEIGKHANTMQMTLDIPTHLAKLARAASWTNAQASVAGAFRTDEALALAERSAT